jgi:hypothetical protein
MTCAISSKISTTSVCSEDLTHADTTRPRAIEETERAATPRISSGSTGSKAPWTDDRAPATPTSTSTAAWRAAMNPSTTTLESR